MNARSIPANCDDIYLDPTAPVDPDVASRLTMSDHDRQTAIRLGLDPDDILAAARRVASVFRR